MMDSGYRLGVVTRADRQHHGILTTVRLPNTAHTSRPWRIREIVPDFTLEDVWALPAYGGADDFPRLLELGTSLDPANADSLSARALWRIRDRLGAWFELGRISEPDDGAQALPIPGTEQTSLTERLPDDLRNSPWDRCIERTPRRLPRSRTRPCTA
jgi:hypothetical protein